MKITLLNTVYLTGKYHLIYNNLNYKTSPADTNTKTLKHSRVPQSVAVTGDMSVFSSSADLTLFFLDV